jgi:hypothetical protein
MVFLSRKCVAGSLLKNWSKSYDQGDKHDSTASDNRESPA